MLGVKIFNKHLVQFLVSTLIVTMIFSGYGCAANRSLPFETHLELYTNKIALVPSRMSIQSSLNLYAEDKIEGALKGAGTGFGSTFQVVSGGSCQGAMCGGVLLVALAAAVVGASVGAIHGVATSPAESKVKKKEEWLKVKTQGSFTQQKVSQLLLDKAHENPSLNIELVPLENGQEMPTVDGYDYLKRQGFQELITANLTKVDFKGGKGKNPPLALRINAVVDVIDLNNPEEVFTRAFDFVGSQHSYKEWMAKNPVELKKDFDLALRSIINDIYTDIFLVVDLPISSGFWNLPGTSKYACCWICPEDPPLNFSFWQGQWKYPLLESTQPSLRWSDFPDDRQAKQFKTATGKNMENVYYDLKIWRPKGDLVYQAINIPQNFHKLELELQSHSKYHWSIRACFFVEGTKVCTKWARSSIPIKGSPFKDICDELNIPPENYYRFKTP